MDRANILSKVAAIGPATQAPRSHRTASTRPAVLVCSFCLLLSLAGTALQAQRWKQWAEPYKRGLDAIQSGDYAAAATELEQAIQADNRPGRSKPTSGGLGEDYFPQVYLGIAYFHLNRLQDASANFDQAEQLGRLDNPRRNLIRDYRQRIGQAGAAPSFTDFESRIRGKISDRNYQQALTELDQAPAPFLSNQQQKAAIDNMRGEAQTGISKALLAEADTLRQNGDLAGALSKLKQAEALPVNREEVRKAVTAIDGIEARYAQLKREGDAAYTQKDWTTADEKYSLALSAWRTKAEDDGLPARLKEVADNSSIASIEAECLRSLEGGAQGIDYAKSARDCQTALDRGSSNSRVQTALNRSQSMQLLSQGEAAARGGDLDNALSLFRQAKEKDASNTRAARLHQSTSDYQGRLTTAAQALNRWRSNPAPSNRTVLEQARQGFAGLRSMGFDYPVDVASQLNFIGGELSRLDQPVTTPTPTPADVPATTPNPRDVRAELREALRTLFQGEARQARIALEGMLARSQGQGLEQHLHAYLGVAYATEALMEEGDSQTPLDKALEEFRILKGMRADYPFDPDYVSPLILSLYQKAGPATQ